MGNWCEDNRSCGIGSDFERGKRKDKGEVMTVKCQIKISRQQIVRPFQGHAYIGGGETHACTNPVLLTRSFQLL